MEYIVRVWILLLHFPCFWVILFHFYGMISIPKEIDLRKGKRPCRGPMNEFYIAVSCNLMQNALRLIPLWVSRQTEHGYEDGKNEERKTWGLSIAYYNVQVVQVVLASSALSQSLGPFHCNDLPHKDPYVFTQEKIADSIKWR